AAALVKAQRRRITFLRRRLDQQHTPPLPAHFVLDEAEEELAEALPLMPRIDGDPIQIEDPLGLRRGAVGDVALDHAARAAFGRLEDEGEVFGARAVVEGGVDELDRGADLVVRKSCRGNENLADPGAILRL